MVRHGSEGQDLERAPQAFELLSDARQLRKSWLADLTQVMDRYLRSPAFLELMQTSLEAMTGAKLLRDQLAEQMTAPPVPDFVEASGRLCHTAEIMLAYLKAIEDSLISLPARTDDTCSPR